QLAQKGSYGLLPRLFSNLGERLIQSGQECRELCGAAIQRFDCAAQFFDVDTDASNFTTEVTFQLGQQALQRLGLLGNNLNIVADCAHVFVDAGDTGFHDIQPFAAAEAECTAVDHGQHQQRQKHPQDCAADGRA